MERKRLSWFWIVTAMMSLPVGYLLTFIPLSWGFNHNYLKGDGFNQFASIYTIPYTFAIGSGPEWLRDPLMAYGDWLRKL